MNKLILIFALAWGTAFGGMLDADGNPIPDVHGLDLGAKLLEFGGFNIADVTLHCDLKGYFIYDGTIYQCVKIREGVTKAELREYTISENERLRARYAEFLRKLQGAEKHK